jgi:hypothetical protein
MNPLLRLFSWSFIRNFALVIIFSQVAKVEMAAAVPTPTPTPTPQTQATETSAPKRQAVVLLTRAVGEVGDRIITSREVRINDAIEQVMTEAKDSGAAPRVLNGSEKIFPAEVAKILDEWIVYLEAKTLSSQPLARGDIGAAIKKVHEQWDGKAGWQELEVSAEELRDTIERKLIAKEFERLKSDPQLAPVSDEDALAYYRKNRLRFGSLPFATFKDNIKTYLIKNQTERRLAEWREVLRRKYKVRNFIAG